MKIEKTYELPFPLASVYDAWVSSATVIPPATAMDIKPEVGGRYRLIVDGDEFSARNEGEFLRVEPYCRVTYTWEWNGDGEVSTIDVVFAQTHTGTRVRLTHSGFSKMESVASHDSGWDSYVDGFKAHLARRA